MKSEIRILKLAVEQLMNDVDDLQEDNKELREEITLIKRKFNTNQPKEQTGLSKLLFDTKEVQEILGICYNTLQKVVNRGLLKPIRINQRNIRYTRDNVLQYLQEKQDQARNKIA